MSWSDLNNEDGAKDASTPTKARLFLVFVLLVAICSMAGSAFIMADKFLKLDASANADKWSGASIFVSTLTILLSAFLMRATTLPPADL